MNRICIILAIVASVAAAGCSGVRNLSVPATTVPLSYNDAPANDTLCFADEEWWEFYTDPVLRDFIHKTLANNKDLLTAAARIEEMRQLLGVDKANLLPTINGNIYANDETNDYSGAGLTHDREIGVKMPISWEMNLMGSLLWARRKGEANYIASTFDYRAMQVSLIAATAEAYFRLIALQNELSIVRQTEESRRESLRMAKIRFEGGLTSETIYQQALVQYSSTASLVPNLEKQVKAARNALTLLMGEFPHELECSRILDFSSKVIEQLQPGIPSQLLRRRPDVMAAEQRLAAARAEVGVKYAERFPTFQIGFTGGLENNELKDFLKSPFTYIFGSVTGPVFDFGRKKRKYKAAVAAYEQARLQYEKTVIQAFTEVDNALNAYKAALQSSQLKINLRDAASKYIHLAQLQYNGNAGTLTYIDVLDAQRRYFEAQIDVSNAVRDEYFVLIGLYKALGGGWSITENEN